MPQPKGRRWWQFSLGTFIIAVTAFAAGLGLNLMTWREGPTDLSYDQGFPLIHTTVRIWESCGVTRVNEFLMLANFAIAIVCTVAIYKAGKFFSSQALHFWTR